MHFLTGTYGPVITAPIGVFDAAIRATIPPTVSRTDWKNPVRGGHPSVGLGRGMRPASMASPERLGIKSPLPGALLYCSSRERASTIQPIEEDIWPPPSPAAASR